MLETMPSEGVQTGFGGVAWLVILAFTLTGLALGFWWVRRFRSQQSHLTPEDTTSLVKITYQNDRDPLRQGYLRSLTADRATLVVTDGALRKGSQVRLDLGSLHPQAQQGADMVLGRVTQTKRLNGSSEKLLVNVQFLEHSFSIQDLGRQP